LLGPALFRVLTPNGGTPDAVRDAGRTAAATLELAPHAAKLLDEHRNQRRRLIGTTHAPVEAAEAIAKALGLDAVIAGPDVHGRGKLGRLREWTKDNGASLPRSYYYGGSLADAPVLPQV